MAKVIGIGGIFVKTPDKERLHRFYREALGMELESWGGCIFPDRADGKSLWSTFDADTEHFRPSTREFMINLRVDDLAGVLERARAFGANVLNRGESSEFGKFGYVVDPDGTLVELWEPPANEPSPG